MVRLASDVELQLLSCDNRLLAAESFPLFHAIEAKLCVAMANEAVPAQVSILLFEKAVARVFRNHQGSRI